MKKCSECGYENLTQAEFCKECYTPLAPTPSVSQPEDQALQAAMLAFNCPKCGAQLLFETATPGMNVKCPPCGAMVQAPSTFSQVSSPGAAISSGSSPTSRSSRLCFNCGEFTPSPEPVCRFCQTSFRPLSVAVIGAFYVLGGIEGVIGIPLLVAAGDKMLPLAYLLLYAIAVFSGFAVWTGFSLLKGKPWARFVAIAICLINAITNLGVVLLMNNARDTTLIEVFEVGVVLNLVSLGVLLAPRTAHYFQPPQIYNLPNG
jgi:hypothetical protein